MTDSVEIKSELMSWTSESLRDAIRKGLAVLKENVDGKADRWKKFRLVETVDGDSICGWAACVDCLCCIMFKSKSADGSVKPYGTKNMCDHVKSCYHVSGSQISMASFAKRVPGKRFTVSEKAGVKVAGVRLVAEAGLAICSC